MVSLSYVASYLLNVKATMFFLKKGFSSFYMGPIKHFFFIYICRKGPTTAPVLVIIVDTTDPTISKFSAPN